LQKLGLNLGTIYEKDSSSEPGIVLSHDPTTGTKINRGQVIDLVVSRGEPKVETVEVKQKVTRVPNVENASLDVARDGIEGRGLHVGSVTSQESTQAEGTIIAQYPSPDAEVELGSSVDLVVAKHAEPQPETQPEPVHEPEPERQPQSTETQPSQSEFPEIPVDVPSREGDQQKQR